MQTRSIRLSDVIYNAATQSFEALVTVHDGNIARNYACAINAPIDMSFEDAAEGLKTKALRHYRNSRGMYSHLGAHTPSQRAGRPRFDPMRWLESLMNLPGQRAA
ncbi:MAG: orotidine 5-phosphate decarboxylase [Pseudomonadota bacterium]